MRHIAVDPGTRCTVDKPVENHRRGTRNRYTFRYLHFASGTIEQVQRRTSVSSTSKADKTGFTAGFSYGSSSIATGAGQGSNNDDLFAVLFALARFLMDRVTSSPTSARTARAPMIMPTSWSQ